MLLNTLRHLPILKRLSSDFIMSQENPKHCRKTIGLQYCLTIPRSVKFLYENLIDFNENRYLLKYLNEVSSSDDWFPYEYIDAEVNNKLDKTKGRLAGNEMENETKHYVYFLHHDPNWLNTITI